MSRSGATTPGWRAVGVRAPHADSVDTPDNRDGIEHRAHWRDSSGRKTLAGRVELLNFNPLAVNKYELMNRSTEFFDGMAPLSESEIAALQTILESEGLSVVREHKRSDTAGR